jgi:hypothetical protein
LVQYNPSSSFQQPSTTILGGTNLINSGSNTSQCGFNIQTGISVNKQDQANSAYSYGSNMSGQIVAHYNTQRCTNPNKIVEKQEFGASVRNAIISNSQENIECVRAKTELALNGKPIPENLCGNKPTHELFEVYRTKK